LNTKGVSLLELIIAIVFIVFVLLMMGLFVPRATKLALDNRLRWQGSELSRARIEQIKTQPYSLITVTTNTNPPFPSIAANGCDCRKVDMSQEDPMLNPTHIDASSTTYTVQSCINYVDITGGGWQSKCPTGTLDTGTKAIRVYTSWKSGNQVHATESELLVSR